MEGHSNIPFKDSLSDKWLCERFRLYNFSRVLKFSIFFMELWLKFRVFKLTKNVRFSILWIKLWFKKRLTNLFSASNPSIFDNALLLSHKATKFVYGSRF